MAYQDESTSAKRVRRVLTATGHGHHGGHLRIGGSVMKHADAIKDKEMIRKAVEQHEEHDHKGEKKTRLRLADGGVAGGPMAQPSASKSPRGKGKGAAKNHIAIVIAPQGQGQGAAPPRPVPVPVPGPSAGAPPPMPPRPMPPPGGMPPMGAAPPMGGPGMPPPGGLPMRKHGGRAHHDPKIAREAREEGESYEHELREHEHRARGGRTSHGRSESEGAHMPWSAQEPDEHGPMKMERPEQEIETAEGEKHGGRAHRRHGGRAEGGDSGRMEYDDTAYGEAPKERRARGGEVGRGRVEMHAGSGSGEGRLEKIGGKLEYCGGGRA